MQKKKRKRFTSVSSRSSSIVPKPPQQTTQPSNDPTASGGPAATRKAEEPPSALGRARPGTQEIVRQTAELQYRHGPTPPVEEVTAWATLVQDAPERFLRLAERQMEQRHMLERAQIEQARILIEAQVEDMRASRRLFGRGQWFALTVCVLGFGIATTFLVFGAPTEGAIMGGATLATMVTAFLVNKWKEEGKSQEADEPNPGKQADAGE